MTKTVVGLYDDLADARSVVDDLVRNGIERDNISLIFPDPEKQYAHHLGGATTEAEEVASGAAAGAIGGAIMGGLSGVLLGLGAVLIPGIGPVIAAGPIVAGLLGAGMGAAAGGLVGALVSWGIPEEEAHFYSEGVRRGGTLVAVTSLEDQVEHITHIMNQHNPVNLRERAGTWRRAGWTGEDTTLNELGEMEARTGNNYQAHYEAVYAHTNRPYPDYQAAYHYGYTLGIDPRYRDRDWNELEPEARQYWETNYYDKGAWNDFKEAVKYAWGEMTDWVSDDYDHNYYEHHYQANYAKTGKSYSYYEPAYHFGHLLATDPNYRARNWRDLEPQFRQRWESEYGSQGAWDEIKGAVRHAWDRLSNWGDYDSESYQAGYRTHYNTSYASTGRPYDYYEPAYRYGTMMAMDERYHGRNWRQVEPEIRRQWESEHPSGGTWEDIGEAIQYTWDQVSQRERIENR